MSKQYIVTVEEMKSLVRGLELKKLKEERKNIHTGEDITLDEMHRLFHYEVIRWAQAVGFDSLMD